MSSWCRCGSLGCSEDSDLNGRVSSMPWSQWSLTVRRYFGVFNQTATWLLQRVETNVKSKWISAALSTSKNFSSRSESAVLAQDRTIAFLFHFLFIVAETASVSFCALSFRFPLIAFSLLPFNADKFPFTTSFRRFRALIFSMHLFTMVFSFWWFPTLGSTKFQLARVSTSHCPCVAQLPIRCQLRQPNAIAACLQSSNKLRLRGKQRDVPLSRTPWFQQMCTNHQRTAAGRPSISAAPRRVLV